MSTPAITVSGLSLYYKQGMFARESFCALADLSFEIQEGETFGIIGRNGSGKSSLLRMLAGIMEPDQGTVESYGRSSALLSLQVGFLSHLTGRQNAVLSGLLLGGSRAAVEEKLNTIIEFAELEDFIDSPIRTYSSGMRARLGFSVAIHMEADIVLIDEVLGVGDVDFRRKSNKAMKEKIGSNRTVVLASHSSSTITELCDRVLWIEQGVPQTIGTPTDVMPLYEAYDAKQAKANAKVRRAKEGR